LSRRGHFSKLGRCLHGGPIDAEIGDLIGPSAGKAVTYVRYNREFNAAEIAAAEALHGGKFALNNLKMRDYLINAGCD
jgi:hypothetical protein